MRLNKYIATCGVASRRKADELIQSGKVQVNNKKVVELGTRVDEKSDIVKVNGHVISLPEVYSYILLHKPKGCTTTVKDEKADRKTVFSYIDEKIPGLVPVGRLDYNTEGLLLLTNDGEMVFNLTHPKNEIRKIYIVEVEGDISLKEVSMLEKGVLIDNKYVTKEAKIFITKKTDKKTRMEMIITEGKNRQIRKMFEAIGKEVIFLKRIAIEQIKLGGLTRGQYRHLKDTEIKHLKSLYSK